MRKNDLQTGSPNLLAGYMGVTISGLGKQGRRTRAGRVSLPDQAAQEAWTRALFVAGKWHRRHRLQHMEVLSG